MVTLEHLPILICLNLVSVYGMLSNNVEWTPEDVQKVSLNHLVQSSNGTVLFVTGTNRIYSLNASTLHVITYTKTGPVGGEDDISRLLVYHETAGPRTSSSYIWSCGSISCGGRDSNTLEIRNTLGRFIEHEITGFFVNVESSVHRYVGCPHEEYNTKDLCSNPGIYDMDENSWQFKSINQANVLTETFVAAFPITRHRFFFSVQKDKDTNRKLSRIAQVCRYADSTRKTYVDMPVKCGNFTVLKAVTKSPINGGNDTLVTAVYFDEESMSSAICSFTLESIKER